MCLGQVGLPTTAMGFKLEFNLQKKGCFEEL